MNELVALPTPIHSDAGDPRSEIRIGSMIAGAFFVLFLGWAAFIPLDAGVNAAGTIAVVGNRQTVQHKDGGFVTAINVREGQHVKAGDVLVELAAPELKASADATGGRSCSASASAPNPARSSASSVPAGRARRRWARS
jgi:multidrug efflux pump subunit AcrA (membrane-fusion protein)